MIDYKLTSADIYLPRLLSRDQCSPLAPLHKWRGEPAPSGECVCLFFIRRSSPSNRWEGASGVRLSVSLHLVCAWSTTSLRAQTSICHDFFREISALP